MQETVTDRSCPQRYALGDHIAREQLKDIVINLQMALLTNLSESLTRDVELNLGVLQIASDNSRVDAVMAMCQLYQRLSQAEPLRITPTSRVSTLSSGMGYSPLSQSPPDHRLSHVSTMSSTGSFSGPTSPLSTSAPARQGFNRSEPSSPYTQETRRSSGGSSLTTRPRSFFSSLRNRNSQRYSTGNQFTIPPVTESGEEGDRVLSNRLEVGGSMLFNAHQRRQPDHGPRGEYFSPDEVNPWAQPDPEDDPDLVLSPFRPDDPERTNIFDPDGWGSLSSERTPERSVSTHGRTASSIISGHSSHSSASGTLPISSGTSMSLYLPCEENSFAGFCKGAWKMQLGLKKAFSIRTRPSGVYNDIPFSRCSKCSYEGPVVGEESRSSWRYDDQVRIHRATGIRYRWVFLAKSHFHCKRMPEQTDGSVGTFGCIFCCAEQRRQAPAFGNLASFMEHLLQHRQMAPGMGPLLDRTRCIVGRVASISEDFDINLPA